MILRYDRVFLLDLEEATIEAGQFVLQIVHMYYISGMLFF